MQRLFCTLLFVVFAGCSPAEPPQVAAPAKATPTAAVAMPDVYGAQVAEDILRAGGNAVDAAIAAGLALAVTYPEAGNIGGGGFMLIHIDGAETFLDYRETAPLAAHRDMYLDDNGDVIRGASLIGHLAVGVPGTVAGFWEAHQRYGTLPWRDLVMPSVKLAENGFTVSDSLGGGMLTMGGWFIGKTNFSKYFGAMKAGTTFRQPELATTLQRIADQGPEDFYRGKTAELIVAEMQRGNGLITMEDLAAYKPVWREPLRAEWRGYEIVSAPPPSSGGFAVIQLLKMKDYLAHLFEGVPHNSAQYVHLVAEMEKRVFADRQEYLGDPDYVDTRVNELIDPDYIAMRAQQVNPHTISTLDAAGPGLESPDTTHYSILDQWGNAVSNTYTLNIGFGSGVVVEGGGFLLNDEMDDFSVKPGVPNTYGVIGFKANEIQPGKRMLSSMTPTLLMKDGEVEMVVGTPGGTTIFTSVFQAIANILDFGMSPEQAVDATRFHHQLMPPDLITYSPSRPLSDETISSLGDVGYKVVPHAYDYGDLQVILRDGDALEPASDPRNRGNARVISDLPEPE
ncbi:MAG: gamma-glutamyltransferase [Woeseia sp.]|nr:gamma-glutamyltransferase [Woeseia sp.]MBT8097461.1 gamma-glutamyltransferase [Woeseia sp.]NNE61942.1 gamma-glutamyltransferase [Woeseia sp.]NNL53933.1 gamma-glutamyltransferase [Woeseia sp.]